MSTNSGVQDIDVASIWAGVRKALPGLMVCTLLFGSITFAVFALMAKRYVAETQLTITAKPTNPFNAAKSDAGRAATVTPRLDKAAINTHVRALMAPDLLIKVGNSLKLAERAEFNPAIGPVDTFGRIARLLGIGGARSGESVEGRMLATMRKNLVVSSARESRFISIQFTSIDPQLAADVANAIAKAYRDTLREIPVRETNEAVAVLLPKIEKLSGEVLEAEAAAKRFRAETDQLTGGTTTQTLEQQRLATLNASLVKAEDDAAKSEARLIAARELASGGGADTLPEVQQSRIIQDLIAQRVRVERQVNEASAVLLAAHPRMRQLNADLNGLRRSIRREIQTIVNGIAEEVRLGKRRTAQIRRQIAALTQNAVSRSGDEAKLRSLENTAKSKRDELQRLQRQLEDNRTVVDINRVPVESTIVSTARPSSQAVFPKKVPYTLLAMAATLMIGIALIISRRLLAVGGPVAHDRRASDRAGQASDEPRSVADIDLGKAMRGPITEATVPDEVEKTDTEANGGPKGGGDVGEEAEADPAISAAVEADVGDDQAVAVDMPGTDHDEADDTAVGNEFEAATLTAAPVGVTIPSYAAYLIGSAPVDGGFRQLIAGANEKIDPSDEAIDLVAELSDAGSRVLLVDWNLDGKRLHSYIETDGAAALVDVMAGRAEFDDVLVTLPDCNVHYIYTADAPARDELLDEEALNLVLDALDEAYDHVVVVSRYEDARALFETIQGRFDAGMTVAEASVGTPLPSEDSFLAFEVADIEIVHYVRSVAQVAEHNVAHEAEEAAVDQRT